MALSKTGRFLSKAEILGVGVFSPLSIYGWWPPFNVHAPSVLFGRFLLNLVVNPPFGRPTISQEHAVEKPWPPKSYGLYVLPSLAKATGGVYG